MIPTAKRLFALTVTHNRIAHRFEYRVSEWHLALVMLSIGIMLQLGDTFALPPYDLVRQAAEQGTWSAFMIVLGLARLMALIVNGSCPRITSHARYALASVSACTWAFLLFLLLSFDTPLMVGPFLAWGSVVDASTAYRAARDARQADETSGAWNGRTSG